MHRPITEVNSLIRRYADSHREPSISNDYLTTIASRQGKEVIELINIRNLKMLPINILNNPNMQPVSVSLSANGERIAFIRKRGLESELLLYERKSGRIQVIEIKANGIPTKVSLDGRGRTIAVEVSRNGRWDVDLIHLNY